MQAIKKYISLFLLLVISVFIVPKELVHILVNHNDTEDVRTVPDAPQSIEHQHIHCEFLKLNAPLYFSDFKFFSFEQAFRYFTYNTNIENRNSIFVFLLPSLRGPPAVS